MPKMRKTRKEKLIADQRDNTYTYIPTPKQTSERAAVAGKTDINSSIPVAHPQMHTRVITNDYKYLSGDLIKTIILTSSIIIAELLIRFYMKI
jgi:hypothetical protein